MDTLTVDLGSRSYPISIGENLLAQSELFSDAISGQKVMIVTNDVVAPLYLTACKDNLQAYQVDQVILPDGEKYKTLATFETILSALLEAETRA